jgi:hypothetical protein
MLNIYNSQVIVNTMNPHLTTGYLKEKLQKASSKPEGLSCLPKRKKYDEMWTEAYEVIEEFGGDQNHYRYK